MKTADGKCIDVGSPVWFRCDWNGAVIKSVVKSIGLDGRSARLLTPNGREALCSAGNIYADRPGGRAGGGRGSGGRAGRMGPSGREI